jgi:hypothetical protein
MCIKLKWHRLMTCRNEKGQQKTSQDRKKLLAQMVFKKCHRKQLVFLSFVICY